MQLPEDERKDKIIELLRKYGLRITRQRLVILDVILEQQCFSCKQIYYEVIRREPNVGTATIYRMLAVLEELDVIERSNLYRFKGKMRTDEKAPIDYHEILECITCALDAKDAYTAGHSQRVSDMATCVCKLMHLDEDETERIHIAAHLHDIGKIGVPDAVLNKEGKLDDEEWEAMKKHSSIGAEILSKSRQLSELKNIVLCHHERYDGRGYPMGLAGEDIPLGARIIAICDSIDAMTSTRSYRKAHSFEYCYKEIENNLGRMYDPEIGRLVLQEWEKIVAVVQEPQCDCFVPEESGN